MCPWTSLIRRYAKPKGYPDQNRCSKGLAQIYPCSTSTIIAAGIKQRILTTSEMPLNSSSKKGTWLNMWRCRGCQCIRWTFLTKKRGERDDIETRRMDHKDQLDEEEWVGNVVTRTINVIVRGFVGGGITKLARKKHLKEVLNVSSQMQEHKQRESSFLEIKFSASDMSKIKAEHNDPMVI